MSLYQQYADFTQQVSLYPKESELLCYALGLSSEASDELVTAMEDYDITKIHGELGDCQWYACRLAEKLGLSFDVLVHRAKIRRGHVASGLTLVACVQRISVTSGRVAGKVKKFNRDRATWGLERKELFLTEVADLIVELLVASFLALDQMWRMSRTVGNYDDLLRSNMDKLKDRQKRGVLQGEGDNR